MGRHSGRPCRRRSDSVCQKPGRWQNQWRAKGRDNTLPGGGPGSEGGVPPGEEGLGVWAPGRASSSATVAFRWQGVAARVGASVCQKPRPRGGRREGTEGVWAPTVTVTGRRAAPAVYSSTFVVSNRRPSLPT